MQYRLVNWRAFVTAGTIMLLMATLSHGPVSAAGNSVTNITFSPSTPNVLLHNQNVTVSFSYATTQPGGVKIFARPFVGSLPAPNYVASGTNGSPTGSGTGTQFFTISAGTVTVNRVRIQMWNAGLTVVLFEAFLPVNYEFRAP